MARNNIGLGWLEVVKHCFIVSSSVVSTGIIKKSQKAQMCINKNLRGRKCINLFFYSLYPRCKKLSMFAVFIHIHSKWVICNSIWRILESFLVLCFVFVCYSVTVLAIIQVLQVIVANHQCQEDLILTLSQFGFSYCASFTQSTQTQFKAF